MVSMNRIALRSGVFFRRGFSLPLDEYLPPERRVVLIEEGSCSIISWGISALVWAECAVALDRLFCGMAFEPAVAFPTLSMTDPNNMSDDCSLLSVKLLVLIVLFDDSMFLPMLSIILFNGNPVNPPIRENMGDVFGLFLSFSSDC